MLFIAWSSGAAILIGVFASLRKESLGLEHILVTFITLICLLAISSLFVLLSRYLIHGASGLVSTHKFWWLSASTGGLVALVSVIWALMATKPVFPPFWIGAPALVPLLHLWVIKLKYKENK